MKTLFDAHQLLLNSGNFWKFDYSTDWLKSAIHALAGIELSDTVADLYVTALREFNDAVREIRMTDGHTSNDIEMLIKNRLHEPLRSVGFDSNGEFDVNHC